MMRREMADLRQDASLGTAMTHQSTFVTSRRARISRKARETSCVRFRAETLEPRQLLAFGPSGAEIYVGGMNTTSNEYAAARDEPRRSERRRVGRGTLPTGARTASRSSVFRRTARRWATESSRTPTRRTCRPTPPSRSTMPATSSCAGTVSACRCHRTGACTACSRSGSMPTESRRGASSRSTRSRSMGKCGR